MSLSKLVDMRRTAEEKAELGPMSWNPSEYPVGLSICLCEDELEKLQVEHDDCQVGDIYDLRALAKVTSVSEQENENGKSCRIEMQIIMLGVESESDELGEESTKKPPKIRYKK